MAILIRRLEGGDDPRLPDYVRLGQFLPPESTYRNSIMAILQQIRMTRAGRLVIQYLENINHDAVIVPDTISHPATFVRDPSAASSFSFEGRGSGSKTIIYFTPNSLAHTYPQLRVEPHEVLLHELCHALRAATGAFRLVIDRNDEYQHIPIVSFENVEEFFAVTVTNVHRSQLRKPLRGNHGSWRLRNPEIYNIRPYSTRMRQICTRMPGFASDMARIPEIVAPFNPFRSPISNRSIRINNTVPPIYTDWIE